MAPEVKRRIIQAARLRRVVLTEFMIGRLTSGGRRRLGRANPIHIITAKMARVQCCS